MKEADQIKKLMESLDTVYSPVEENVIQPGDKDPMTGEDEYDTTGAEMYFDWKDSPEKVIAEMNRHLGDYGIKFRVFGAGDGIEVKIIRIDH